jgi:F-box protein 18 (helicase)
MGRKRKTPSSMESVPGGKQQKEEAPPRVIELTAEQQDIVAHVPTSTRYVVIEAYAGTGKTSTFESVVKAYPGIRFLYIVFNKAMQLASQRRFKPYGNVHVCTTHSLALKYTKEAAGKHCLQFPVPISNLRQIERVYDRAISKLVPKLLNKFWTSSGAELTFESTEGMQEADREPTFKEATRIWRKMQKGKLPFTHDAYLKYFACGGTQAVEWLEKQWDVILLDEAQDSNRVLLDLLLQLRRTSLYLVGDAYQNIYRFRKSVNAMAITHAYAMKHGHSVRKFYLTQSFRFGSPVGWLCTRLLRKLYPLDNPVRGTPDLDTAIYGQYDLMIVREHAVVRAAQYFTGETIAVVSRTNAGAFRAALAHLCSSADAKPRVIGEALTKIKSYISKARAYPEGVAAYFDKEIEAAQKFDDQAEESTLRYIKASSLDRLEESIGRITKAGPRGNAKPTAVFGTVHGHKGLEYDTVVVDDDFREVVRIKPENIDEIHLLYIAVSRAQRNLILSPDLSTAFRQHISHSYI